MEGVSNQGLHNIWLSYQGWFSKIEVCVQGSIVQWVWGQGPETDSQLQHSVPVIYSSRSFKL